MCLKKTHLYPIEGMQTAFGFAFITACSNEEKKGIKARSKPLPWKILPLKTAC